MATIRILSATKKEGDTYETVEALLTEAYPDWRVENLVEEDGTWKARMVQAADDVPAFLKEKGKKKDESSDSSDSSDDDGDSDSSDDSDDDDSDSDEKSDKGKSKSDPVAEVQKIMDELQGLLSDLGGKTQELQDAHDDKADKLKDIADTVGDDGEPAGPPRGLGPKAEMTPDQIGPTPQSGPVPPVPRRPGMGMPGGMPPGSPSAFSSRRRTRRATEIATHPGINEKGERISLTAAMAELEADPKFKDYEVVQTRQEGGKYIAKLQLKRRG